VGLDKVKGKPMRFRAVPVAILSLAILVTQADALETLYIVRHAEKVASWPDGAYLDSFRPLSAAGVERADELAAKLADAGIAAIYASRTTRSLQTGVPLSDQSGATLSAETGTVDATKMKTFLADLGERHEGDAAVLVIGHSNTIPELLLRLGAVPECFERIGIDDTPDGLRISGYDGLWKVDLSATGCARIERHRVGP
jgi:broad specificity phosphatase PhoE